MRPLGLGRGNGAVATAGHGPGRGHGRGDINHEDIDDELNGDNHVLHRNYGYHLRGNQGQEQPEEGRFGKLKFSMPKVDGVSNSEAYLTWELKVGKIFRMHNYFEENLAMTFLKFDDYALIWWEQVQNQREEAGEPTVAT